MVMKVQRLDRLDDSQKKGHVYHIGQYRQCPGHAVFAMLLWLFRAGLGISASSNDNEVIISETYSVRLTWFQLILETTIAVTNTATRDCPLELTLRTVTRLHSVSQPPKINWRRVYLRHQCRRAVIRLTGPIIRP